MYQRVTEAIKNGGSLPGLSRLLTLAERDARRRGSESYLPEVEKACPQSLLSKLADPPPGWRAYSDAAKAAQKLTSLILDVANREWSPAAAAPAEFSGLRAALDGVQQALLAYADQAAETGRGLEDGRPVRLGEIIAPILQDLVIRVLIDEADSPSADGAEAHATGANRAGILLTEWTQRVATSGLLARPSFAVSEVDVGAYASTEAAHIRETLLAPITGEMWQLCSPEDLSTLDVVRPPHVVRFASRLTRDALAGTPPMEDIVWTSSGSYAGVLRLLSLRPGIAASHWNQPGR